METMLQAIDGAVARTGVSPPVRIGVAVREVCLTGLRAAARDVHSSAAR